MFATYNLESFGLELKRIRKLNRCSQKDVYELCGINPDTLRRLENGYTIPKYETLEILSDIYKVDLLNLLIDYRSNEKLYKYYNRLDELISNYDIEVLKDLGNDLDDFMKGRKVDLISPTTYDQLKLMLKGISQFNSKDMKEKLNCLDTFISAVKLSVKDFDLLKYKEFNYNILEIRILILIALGLAEHKDFILSNDFLNFTLENMDLDSRAEYEVSILIIKVYIQLSYNSHSLNNHSQAHEYANMGIDYCVKRNLMFVLYLLYYRKGAAEFLLGDSNYMESFRTSIMLLEIQEKSELAELYKKVANEKYGISI